MTTTEERPKTKEPLLQGRKLWQFVVALGIVAGLIVSVSTIWDRTQDVTPANFGRSSAPADLNNAATAKDFLNFLDTHANQHVRLDIHCNPGPALPVACNPNVQSPSIENWILDIRPSGFGENAGAARTLVTFAKNNADVTVQSERFGGITVDGVFSVPRSATTDAYTTVYNLRATQDQTK